MNNKNNRIYNLLLEISNYNKGNYLNEFHNDIQKFHKGFERPLIKAISDMSINIGIEEYCNFLNNKSYMTGDKYKNFIKYAFDNEQFTGLFEKFKVKKNIKFDDNLNVFYLPNLILEEIISYNPKEKTPTIFDVIDKEIYSFN